MPFKTLVLDLGDVCFSYSKKAITAVPPRTLKSIFDCPAWHEQECGTLSRQDCFDKVSKKFGLEVEDLNTALKQAVESLTPKEGMIKTVRELKDADPELRVYAMSNISATDFEATKPLIDSWNIFDGLYPSAYAGTRKPEFAFFHHVFDKTDLIPASTVFVDDKFENVMVGQSLGLHGIHFDGEENVVRKLRIMFGDPIQRGEDYLSSNAGMMFCETNTGTTIRDNFAQLLIYHITGNMKLVSMSNHKRTWNFFQGKPLLTTETFPDDLDDTALALLISDDKCLKHSVMDEMLRYITKDGMPLTYFDPERPRFDPFVGANVLRLFYQNRRGLQLASTLQWMHRVLFTRAYKFGTRYYHLPEWLFYYLGELCAKHNDPELEGLRLLLNKRLVERIGCNTDITAACLRLLTCQALNVPNEKDLQTLLAAQQSDGGWEIGWLNRYGATGIKVGSRGVVTAMAVKGIRAAGDLTEAIAVI